MYREQSSVLLFRGARQRADHPCGARRLGLTRSPVALKIMVGGVMADIKVRNHDDRIADILQARAKQQGLSLEEEIRRTLAASRCR